MTHTPGYAALESANYEPDDKVRFRFIDGREGVISFSDLGLDAIHRDVASIKVSPSGTAVEVKRRSGDVVPIDAAILRALVDSGYSDALTQAFAPYPNMDMLKAIVQIGIIHKKMNPKECGRTSVEYIREGREGGLYGDRRTDN